MRQVALIRHFCIFYVVSLGRQVGTSSTYKLNFQKDFERLVLSLWCSKTQTFTVYFLVFVKYLLNDVSYRNSHDQYQAQLCRFVRFSDQRLESRPFFPLIPNALNKIVLAIFCVQHRLPSTFKNNISRASRRVDIRYLHTYPFIVIDYTTSFRPRLHSRVTQIKSRYSICYSRT